MTTNMITMTKDCLNTFCKGMLGALTMGAYTQYITGKMIERERRDMEKQNKLEMETQFYKNKKEMDIQETKYQIQIDQLKKEIKEIKQKQRWF